MGAANQVFVVISAQGISEKINDLVEGGYFAEARDLDFQLHSINDKVKSLIQERGGKLLLSTYEKIVLEVPYSIAEDMPNTLLIGYKKFFGGLMYVGIGLDLREALLACRKSHITGNIEMYDPEQNFDVDLNKSIDIDDNIFSEGSPNLYDHSNPPVPQPSAQEQTRELKYKKGVTAEQAMQIEAQAIQMQVQQLNSGAEQIQQQMEQQMQQQAQQQPKNLNEALNGGPVEGQEQQAEEKEPKVGEKEMAESKSKEKEDEDDNKESDKLATLLETVNEKIPKLSGLAEKNPEAFKKVISLVHKLVDMAKQKKVEKAEVAKMTEDLNKAIKMHYPLGTVKNGKKKVEIGGKAKWRSVRAGQVKDVEGNAISVASHNAKVDDGTEGVR